MIKFINSKVDWLGMSLTNSCNLNCVYCYANAKKDGVVLSEKTAKIFLEYFSKFAKPDILLVFTGGEPTLNPHLVDLIKYSKKLFINPKIVVTTNGVMPKKTLDELLAQNILLQISFEGLPEINDVERPSFSGPSSEKIVKTIKYAFSKNPEKTIMRLNNSPSKFGREKEIAKYLKNLGVTKISLGALHPSGRGKNYDAINFNESTRRLVDFYEILLKEGIDVKKPILKGTPNWPGCSAGERTFFLTADGVITGCQLPSVKSEVDKEHEHFILGEVKDEVLFDKKRLDLFRKFAKDVPGACMSCKIKDNYCGGCLWYKKLDGDSTSFPQSFCESRFSAVEFDPGFH